MKNLRVDELKKGDIIVVEIDDGVSQYMGRGYGWSQPRVKEVFGRVKGTGDKNGDPIRIRFYNFKTKETTRLQLYRATIVKVLDEEEADLMMLIQ